ncbi:MAG: hypothetical protein ABIP55_11640 [Tepidisphaeraceae bacterium]
MIDAIVALGLIVLLTTMFATAVNRQRKGADRLATSREATRLAEQAMVALQTSQPAPTPPDGATLQVHASGAGTAPAGWKWIRIDVTSAGRTSTLTGLAPTVATTTTEGAGR